MEDLRGGGVPGNTAVLFLVTSVSSGFFAPFSPANQSSCVRPR